MTIERIVNKLPATPQVPSTVDPRLVAQLQEYHSLLKELVEKVNELVERVNEIP